MVTSLVQSDGQYLTKAKCISLKTHSLGQPEHDEVQIEVRSVTVCGSVLHYFSHGRNGTIVPKQPLCLGHESSGIVVGVGNGVRDIRVGDRVAIESGVPCSQCTICDEGRYNLCPALRFRGSGSAFPHYQGMLQERINHPSQWVHVFYGLPPTLSYEDGALLEPLAVAIHAVRRPSIQPGQNCLIFGAGAVGLLCAAAATYAGCGTITIADIDECRLAFAQANGFADFIYTVEPRRGVSVEESLLIAREVASSINLLSSPSSKKLEIPKYVFECTGAEACVQAAIYITRSGGKVLLVGMGTPNHILPISEASAREINLIPTWRHADCYPEAIQLMTLARKGDPRVPDITTLITHRFEGLDNVLEAFCTAGKTRDEDEKLVIKVAVNMAGRNSTIRPRL